MAESVFELVTAAADEPFRHSKGELILRFDGVAGFPGLLAIDLDGARHDGALGFFATFTQSAFYEALVQTAHAGIQSKFINVSRFSAPEALHSDSALMECIRA